MEDFEKSVLLRFGDVTVLIGRAREERMFIIFLFLGELGF